MKKRPSPGILAAFFSLALISASSSSDGISVITINSEEFVPLDELVSRTGAEQSFDMATQKGRIYRKGHQAVYCVGLSVVLIDGRMHKSSMAVRRRTGAVLIPLDAGELIIRSFDPAARPVRRESVLHLERSPDKKQESTDRERYGVAARDRIRFIVLDPGHGGKDPGAVGKGGLLEKDITLKVANYLEKRIRSRLPELRITVTRKDDRFIELSGRTRIANRLLKKDQNGLFISIHVNSSLSSRTSGYETFFLSQNPTNEEARNTAALENNVIILEERSNKKRSFDDVDFIEAAMITTQIQKESAELAKSIQAGLVKDNRTFGARGVKKADFYVLRGVLMPAVLVEIGFITNKNEAQHLKKSSHQEKVADGIADGIDLFIKKYNRLIKVN